MTAIKLALYGRHALGIGTSMSAYHSFLRESVHISSDLMVRSQEAFVEIDFVYGKLGDRSHYTVRRAWSTRGRRVQEELSVAQDHRRLSLSAQDCQGFLNELVPIGVSETVLLRRREDRRTRGGRDGPYASRRYRAVARAAISSNAYAPTCASTCCALPSTARRGGGTDEAARVQAELRRAPSRDRRPRGGTRPGPRASRRSWSQSVIGWTLLLNERSGDWGRSRESWRTETANLTDRLLQTERELRDELAGIYPLALASNVLTPALEAAGTILKARTWAEANDLLTSFAATLKDELDVSARRKVDRLLNAAVKHVPPHETGQDVSHLALGRMEHAIRHSIPESRARVECLADSIQITQRELDAVTLRLEQAPDQAAIAQDVAKLADLEEQISAAAVALAVRKRELKTRYRLAIDKARKLRDSHIAFSEQRETTRPLEYAQRSRRLLKDFRRLKAQRMIAELEYEFTTALSGTSAQGRPRRWCADRLPDLRREAAQSGRAGTAKDPALRGRETDPTPSPCSMLWPALLAADFPSSSILRSVVWTPSTGRT